MGNIQKNQSVNKDLGQIDPRELSPHIPIRWAEFDLDSRPYDSPHVEYVRSPYPVSIPLLRERWHDVFDERSLKMLRETAQWKEERVRYQDMVAREAFTSSLAGDVDFQKRRIDREITEICDLIEKTNANLERGYEYASSKGAGAFGYVQRPISADSYAKLINARLALSDALAKRLGLANDVLKITVGVEETLEERMSRFMAQSDPEFAALQRVVEMGALNTGRIGGFDGDNAMASARSDREMGRIIDATPLPRATQNDESSTR